MIAVKLAKFELYPKEKPTGYAVGFNIALDNGESFYRDTVVGLEYFDGSNMEEVVSEGWNMIKDPILTKIVSKEIPSLKVGDDWSPPDLEKDLDDKRLELNPPTEPAEPIGDIKG